MSRTKSSGDKGADLILERAGEQTVIQAKRRQATIGVKAIQEVYATSGFYQATHAIAITTSRFSRPVVDFTNQLGIELWDRERLLTELRDQQLFLPS